MKNEVPEYTLTSKQNQKWMKERVKRKRQTMSVPKASTMANCYTFSYDNITLKSIQKAV